MATPSLAFGSSEGTWRNCQIVTGARLDQRRPMPVTHTQILVVALIFALAGLVKGVTGMGLPTVAMGLLGLLMAPAEAAAVLVVPSLVTNVWQYVSGQHRLLVLRRIWPMLLMICLATSAGAGLIAGDGAERATLWLGAALIAYAATGLAKIRFSIPQSYERWLSPAIGAATGVVTGATGVFVIPAVPYLQALGFDTDDLVQVLGLSFTVSTVALAAGLFSHGAFHISAAGASTLCTLPALAGMGVGQTIRKAVNPATFRRLFLIGLLLLGGNLAARSLM
jgi:uncharacterized membrane protein YfcA